MLARSRPPAAVWAATALFAALLATSAALTPLLHSPDEFSHVVHNDRLDQAADELEQIVRASA